VRARVQGLVYIFIALAALGVAAAAYFGFTFTPIEAIVTALCFGAVAVMLVERQLRQRSEARLERAIEDLARLLSTDAQAGAVLSQRINQLTDTNAGSRLDTIEADISVLGTVVRQVAEAVAELEEARRRDPGISPAHESAEEFPAEADDDTFPEPVIPVEMLKQALAENRLVCHIEPVVQLPQRRPYCYDIVPRLILEDAEFADTADFMPRQGHEDIVRSIEERALVEAVTIARRARTAGQPIRLGIPLTRASLADPPTVELLLATLDANRAIAGSLGFNITQAEWRQLLASEKITLSHMNREGIGLSLVEANSLRFDFGELEGLGFQSVRVDATRFLRNPQHFTDFHTADVVPYARRYHMDIVATGVIDEQQLLTLFEEGIAFVQGPHIARPGPVRPDLVVERGEAPVLRTVEV
jgi:cyclic-di-GMP phosphodiesterase, flagellum assembly factor TipF